MTVEAADEGPQRAGHGSQCLSELPDRPGLGEAELIVAKHRNGPTRDITLAFNPEYTRFMDFFDDSRAGGYV